MIVALQPAKRIEYNIAITINRNVERS
jgi:hypothetical protein